jgi:apolipoprotein N-acyltransferase
MPSWLTRLLAPLRRLARRVKDAIRSVLDRRLGPLAAVASIFGGKRGFGFMWAVATLGVTLALAALVAVLLFPVVALIGLIVAGVWLLVRQVRRRRSDRADEESQADPVPA